MEENDPSASMTSIDSHRTALEQKNENRIAATECVKDNSFGLNESPQGMKDNTSLHVHDKKRDCHLKKKHRTETSVAGVLQAYSFLGHEHENEKCSEGQLKEWFLAVQDKRQHNSSNSSS